MAAYRIAVQHWAVKRAIAEMAHYGFPQINFPLPALLRRIDWLRFRRPCGWDVQPSVS